VFLRASSVIQSVRTGVGSEVGVGVKVSVGTILVIRDSIGTGVGSGLIVALTQPDEDSAREAMISTIKNDRLDISFDPSSVI